MLPPPDPPPLERRERRVPEPPCPVCGGEQVAVVTRTDYVLYFRCAACAAVWSVPKPGRAFF